MTIESAELLKIQKSLDKDYEARTHPNSERAEKEAKEYDLDVVYPADDQLQLDIDTDHAMAIYETMYPVIDKYYGVKDVRVTESRSGLPNRHVTVTLFNKVAPMERIALQACLGSDRVRELLGVVQARDNDPHPTLFLEKKGI